MPEENKKVSVAKVVTIDDRGQHGFLSCGMCGVTVKDQDKECLSCHATFIGLDTSNPYPFGGSDFQICRHTDKKFEANSHVCLLNKVYKMPVETKRQLTCLHKLKLESDLIGNDKE